MFARKVLTVSLWLTLFPAAVACALLAAPSDPSTAVPLASDPFRNDAWLHDVCFVNPQCGWAVGDRGTIWATADGGAHWQPQASGVSCPLYSVCFLDPQTGWAAGGSTEPFVHSSVGVILLTHDGGKTWSRDLKLQLPALRKARFFDARHGWAVGLSSAMYPSGLFVTSTGGRSWQPLVTGNVRAWHNGSFLDARTGVAVGADGALAVVQHGSVQRLPGAPFGLRGLGAVWLVPPQYGWLVGDGGLIAMTGDRGQTWQAPPGAPPLDLALQFDWQALCVRGPKAWIAGSPGTRVLHSADAGRTWQAFATGQSLPIAALTMVDDAHGWAVGALGSIFHTADGGHSWQRQRAGGSRAALLGLVSRPESLPLELLARLCASEGYLGIVETLGRTDVDVTPPRTPLGQRFHEAVLTAGASGARATWPFPLPPTDLSLPAEALVERWDRLHNASGKALLTAHLVRLVRLWRPEIVVAEPTRGGVHPAARLIGQAVADAVRQAADPQQFPEQIALAGLTPWPVKRQFVVLPPGERGAVELHTAQLAPQLGRSLVDLADEGRSLLAEQTLAQPPTIAFQQAAGVVDEAAHDDFFRGLGLPVGGDARRGPSEALAGSLEALSKAAQRRRNILAILEKAGRDPLGDRQLLAQTDKLIEQLDPDAAAWLLYHLAERYRAGGQWDLAADAYRLVVERYPQHSLRRAALTWLVQYTSSAEAAWRGAQRYRTATTSGMAADPAELANRTARAVSLGTQIEASDPALFAEPAVRFPLAAVCRGTPEAKQTERCYAEFTRSVERDAWWTCAQGECWLLERKTPPPKPLLRALSAAVRPKLDGRLEEPLWQQAAVNLLRSPHGDEALGPAQIQLAYDAEFLYVGIVCAQAPQVKYPASTAVRGRDADLSAADRVDLFLDIDRDYVTAYRLTVDYRGWTNDSCWGDRTWEPTWFVAAAAADGRWTIEAAIPLAQLTGQAPSAGAVWAVGVQRIVPGVGFQAWNQPASPSSTPAGFGYLLFE